jgi:cytochrome P450
MTNIPFTTKVEKKKKPPTINLSAGLGALKEMIGPRSLLGALSAMRRNLGYVFRIPLSSFSPVVLAGPQASHYALVVARKDLSWRNESDPVTRLLRHGMLVTDGEEHDRLRHQLMPALHKQQVEGYIPKMWQRTEQVISTWQPGQTYDMLVEMRRIALLTVLDSLFEVDATADLDRLIPVILEILKFISPGFWLLGAPRRNYEQPVEEMNAYLESLIHTRREHPTGRDDLLSDMIRAGTEVGLIRDQMLTLLIAGHDTSTALLAWALYEIGRHPQVQEALYQQAQALQAEAPPNSEQVASLDYFHQVIDETLRLYPPIHVGNRKAEKDLPACGYEIPQGERVMISYYTTHHDEQHWPHPEKFDPARFAPGEKYAPYTFIPFGGGPRNCLGANFARVEAAVILARLLQRYRFELQNKHVRLHMGATLEPRPGVFMKVVNR